MSFHFPIVALINLTSSYKSFQASIACAHACQLFLIMSKGGFPVLARSSSQFAASAYI